MPPRIVLAVAAALTAVALMRCASSLQPPPPTPAERAQALEPMLSAAGFRILPANSPDKQEKLAGLDPLKVSYYVGRTGTLHYFMADPYYCKCMYIGDEQAYQKYEQYKLNEKFERQTAEVTQAQLQTQQELEMNEQMEMFNPYGMGYIGPGYVW